jgi:hypothetical protein
MPLDGRFAGEERHLRGLSGIGDRRESRRAAAKWRAAARGKGGAPDPRPAGEDDLLAARQDLVDGAEHGAESGREALDPIAIDPQDPLDLGVERGVSGERRQARQRQRQERDAGRGSRRRSPPGSG